MKYAIATLGCKVNQYESQAIETMLRERGHFPAERDADVVIVNSCAVTAESSRKSRQAARRLRERHPRALLALCGCSFQLNPDEALELGADLVFGSGERVKLVEAIEARVAMCSIPDMSDFRDFEELPAGNSSGRTRAMLKIQDGCDNFCAYCVIPYVRGRARSLPLERAAALAREIEQDGYRELVLTGIEISSYGKDLPGGASIIDCVEAVAEGAPSARLRLGSLEPTAVTEDFCRRLRALGRVCGHFHLSLQSGCDAVLMDMGRNYDTARVTESLRLLRELFPGCAVGADVIAGFPGETERQHLETLRFVEDCGFAFMHIFPYSKRPGTRAADFPGQLSRVEKARRAADIHSLTERMKADFLRGCIGKTLPVLFESEANGVCSGHADNYCMVSAKGEALRGLVENVYITGVKEEMLVGNVEQIKVANVWDLC